MAHTAHTCTHPQPTHNPLHSLQHKIVLVILIHLIFHTPIACSDMGVAVTWATVFNKELLIQSKYVDLCLVHLISLWTSLCAVTAPEKGVAGSGRYLHVSRSVPQFLMSLMNAWYFISSIGHQEEIFTLFLRSSSFPAFFLQLTDV